MTPAPPDLEDGGIPEPGRMPKLFGRAANAYAVATTAITLGRQARSWYRARTTFTITVRSDDELWSPAQEWLLSVLPPGVHRAVQARTKRNANPWDDDIAWNDSPTELVLSFDDQREQTVVLGGHRITVQVSRADTDVRGGAAMYRSRPDSMTFVARSIEGQHAIVAHLRSLLADHTRIVRKPTLHMVSTGGSMWNSRPDVPLRSLDSIALAAGQAEKIRDDMERFLDSEKPYVQRGLPYHRGYLFEGPPGTGKTSLVRALAQEFGLDLWVLPLGDLGKDANLMALICDVKPRSILLLEDVDTFHAATERDGEKGEVSMSGLLNALDGVGTPHGMITVMTTNHVDQLDDAILRAGRVDVREHIGLPDVEQATRLFRAFYGQAPKGKVLASLGRTTADLTEVFKLHMDDPDGAERALRSLEEAS